MYLPENIAAYKYNICLSGAQTIEEWKFKLQSTFKHFIVLNILSLMNQLYINVSLDSLSDLHA